MQTRRRWGAAAPWRSPGVLCPLRPWWVRRGCRAPSARPRSAGTPPVARMATRQSSPRLRLRQPSRRPCRPPRPQRRPPPRRRSSGRAWSRWSSNAPPPQAGRPPLAPTPQPRLRPALWRRRLRRALGPRSQLASLPQARRREAEARCRRWTTQRRSRTRRARGGRRPRHRRATLLRPAASTARPRQPRRARPARTRNSRCFGFTPSLRKA
mmetsp:Transcript_86314/g.272354  ORF Transcript_86314/g.272354 Transcript_86314/m.272354 type:complete len:211 (+) Transcript_86314:707-1339(+)